MSLQARLIKYLAARPGLKVSKGALCDLARATPDGYTGENTGRRLRYLESCYRVEGTPKEEPEHIKARELLEGAVIKVEHRKRNHDWYWLEPAVKVQSPEEWFDQLPA